MNIIGTCVIHKKFGNGTIASYDNGIINVQFHNKTVRFQFPEAFFSGFLMPIDSKAESNINTCIEELKCDVCGSLHTATELIDEKRYCPKCKKKETTPCGLCGNLHEKLKLKSITNQEHLYQTISICQECAEDKSFVCEKCGKRYLKENSFMKELDNELLCKKCFDKVAKECHYCGNAFHIEEGNSLYYHGDYIDICQQCIPTQTFTCSVCNDLKLNKLLVNSKYIPATKQICSDCVYVCSNCGEEVEEHQLHMYYGSTYGKGYCDSCWNEMSTVCRYCDNIFIPESFEQISCPDCIEMQAYINRLKELDFITRSYKEMSCYMLENINRCDLFTKLYENCEELSGHKFRNTGESPYHFIVMRIINYNVVITYLPSNVIGKVKHSLNITMTKFRSRKGRLDVHCTINNWDKTSEDFLMTSAGKMKILNYPILLRVQTEWDKIYGKEWNGPYDYTEIGNYGDTTKFYIIGLL
ncbi:MAG: hypothetical protein IKV85_05415 [Ruminococcus sp.]|nr:hypothetical protein [Ruminococcus sp.]